MLSFYLKAFSIWLILVGFAIANGYFRENVLSSWLGSALAAPVSGIILSFVVFLISYWTVRTFHPYRSLTFFSLGLFWVALTLIFEFAFGHWGLGLTLAQILTVFDFSQGNLFSLVLLITLVSPWLAAKIRHLI